jgi:hypothetical protein
MAPLAGRYSGDGQKLAVVAQMEPIKGSVAQPACTGALLSAAVPASRPPSHFSVCFFIFNSPLEVWFVFLIQPVLRLSGSCLLDLF